MSAITTQEQEGTLAALTRELDNELAVIERQKDKLLASKGVEGRESHVLHLEKDIAKRERVVRAIREQLAASGGTRRRGQRR